MADSLPDPVELLECWRRHLKDAKLRYYFAKNYAREVMDDFRSGGISETTEMYACRRAIRAERFALAEYARVLGVFTSVALDGKLPAESDSSAYAKMVRHTGTFLQQF